MSSPVRPVFQEGQRLTARGLNEAVEYLRSFLRRVLLAPLSPGVATGLQLTLPAVLPAASFTVTPGLAIEGRGRLLVVSNALTFTAADVQAQTGLLAPTDTFSIALALDDLSASYDPCAPQRPLEVVDRVKLVFRKLPPTATIAGTLFLPLLTVFASLSLIATALAEPWSALDPAGRSSDDFAVRLGHGSWNGTSFTVSMSDRAGVTPQFGGLRNSFGELSLTLGRDPLGNAMVGLTVPSVFGAPATFKSTVDFETDLTVNGNATFQQSVSFQGVAGGPTVQASVVAKDQFSTPAGRVSPSNPAVFEAAGGHGTTAGAGGVLAVSMQYDAGAIPLFHNFAGVPHAGFPLALSVNSVAATPMVAPFNPASGHPPIGLSAGQSLPGPSGSGTILLPVASAGLVMAYVNVVGVVGVDTELMVDATTITDGGGTPTNPTGQYPLKPATSGNFVLARCTAPVSAGIQLVPVWVVPPYLKP
jgi:hypothetical protein